MPSLVEQVTDAAGNVLAPIAENTVARIVSGVKDALDETLDKFSGKEIVIVIPPITIKIPDLKKDA